MTHFILASASPRRKEILIDLDIDFQVKTSKVEENINKFENPATIAMALAFEKAYDVSKTLENNSVIIGADTLVVIDGRIIGKPKGYDDAFRMLSDMSDKEHEVITGFSLINTKDNIKVIDFERTIVKFRKLTDRKIKSYLATEEYVDKAGSYGIQGFGSILVEYIKGCYFNVIGLPIYKLDINLEKFFDSKLL